MSNLEIIMKKQSIPVDDGLAHGLLEERK